MINKVEAADYLQNEIEQMKIILGGILTDEYRSHIEAKRIIFSIAYGQIVRMSNEEFDKNVNRYIKEKE